MNVTKYEQETIFLYNFKMLQRILYRFHFPTKNPIA